MVVSILVLVDVAFDHKYGHNFLITWITVSILVLVDVAFDLYVSTQP